MSQFDIVIDAIERTGRSIKIKNGELETRCPICGDSVKSSFHRHFFISLSYPHPAFCQRCGYSLPYVTTELLEAFGAEERDASVFVRQLEKKERKAIRGKHRPPSLSTGKVRLKIPQPDRNNSDDAFTIGYIENRIGGEKLSEKEIERYKIITCGLYGFLELNDIDQLTNHVKETDRLNDSCIGFLSADESYIIFRSLDEKYVNNGGKRYTNYRLFQDWEGSKSFACRSDINLLHTSHNIVCSEGIIDLIQIERQFYNTERWNSNHIGVATCGSRHDAVLKQLLGLGFISQNLHLYIDDTLEGKLDLKMVSFAKSIKNMSPFFSTPDFKLSVFRNDFIGEKDFGVNPNFIKRQEVKI
jgi:hypothetical protein